MREIRARMLLILIIFFFYAGLSRAQNADIVVYPGLKRMKSEIPSYQREYVTPMGSTQSAYTNREIVEASIIQSFAFFQTWFNTNVQTSDQLVEVATVIIADYYNKLRQCLPGVYRYPIPNILFGWRINNEIEPKYFLATSTIVGQQNGQCIVDTVTAIHNHPSRVYCRYSSQSLKFFNDQRARKAARNNLSYKQQERQKLDDIARECKSYSSS